MPQIITVYHGANALVQNPEIRPVSRPMDFGTGFYATTLITQAAEWARKKSIKEGGTPIVSVYNLNMGNIESERSIKSFAGTSDDWIDFILKHRKASAYNAVSVDISGKSRRRLVAKKGIHHEFDLVMGEVADDDVFDAITLYEVNVITYDELKRRLRTKRENDQLCFCIPASLTYLEFVGQYVTP